MPGGKLKYKAKGFSFTEMSVVLASVAAVIITVSSGVSIMNKSRLNNIVSDVSSFSNSISQFEKKYGALPGDIANISSLAGATAGNGDGTIDSAEALDVWQHLGIAGFIEGDFDGNSANFPGIGVPTADIEGGGYKITPAADTSFNNDADATNDIPDQALIIELAGFSSSSNSLPILTTQDAKSIDEKADDGNPLTGKILAEGTGTNCVNASGNYNLPETVASCRLLFTIRSGKTNNLAPEVSGACAELGQTRQVSDVNQTCPTGYAGKIIETCRINSDNEGAWETTDRFCTEVKCGKDGMFGDIRKLSCINGMKGTEGIVEQCTENGVWKVIRSDCSIVTSTPCATDGDIRPKAQACDWGEQGYMIQTCTNNKWGVPTTNTCSEILCDSDSIGDTQTSNDCGANYSGQVVSVCTVAGEWEKTSVGSTCVPNYSGICTAGVDVNKDIGCPPGKRGNHILTCINADTDYWTTLTDTCEPIKCSGDRNIGSVRTKEGSYCPDNKNGTVMEYCDDTGTWVTINNNCVSGVCEEPNDTEGNAYWPTSEGGSTADFIGCVEGYEEQATPPTRVCNADGSWGVVNFKCQRITCPTWENNATYPLTYAGDNDILGTCDVNYSSTTGFPLADCSPEGYWTNERVGCTLSCPEFGEDLVGVSGMDLWLDAAEECTVFTDASCSTSATPGSSTVGCIKDKSGNDLHATQSTGTYKPNYTSAAAGQNNLPTIQFNGSNQRLNYPDIGDFQSTAAFVVHKEDAYTASGHCLFCSTGWDSDAKITQLYFSSSNPGEIVNYLSDRLPRKVDSSITYTAGQYNISTMIDDNNEALTYKGGSNIASDAITSPKTKMWGPGTVGAWTGDGSSYSYYQDGNIGEIMIFDRDISTSSKQKVEAYMGDKWNINVSTLFEESILWLDADDSSTLFTDFGCSTSASTGQTIGCWQDKSGHDNHAKQATAAKEPLYQANSMNSKPVLLFDRSAKQHLAVPNSSGDDFDLTQSLTVVSVLKFDEMGDYWGTFLARGGSKAEPFDIGTYKEKSASNWRFYFDVGDGGKKVANIESTNGSINTGIDYITTFKSNGGDFHQIYINGALNVTSTDSGTMDFADDDVFIGSFDNDTTEALEGEMAEMLIFPTSLRNNDRTYLEEYLADKWGIALAGSLPLDCTYTSVLPVSGEVLWLDGSDCTTVYIDNSCSINASSSGDSIGCWQDKSGNNLNATQSTASYQPTYEGQGMNSKNTVKFNQNNSERLSIAHNSLLNILQEITIFVVANPKDSGTLTFFDKGNKKPFKFKLEDGKGGTKMKFERNGKGNSYSSDEDTVIYGSDQVLTLKMDDAGDMYYFYIDGVLSGSGTGLKESDPDTTAMLLGQKEGGGEEFDGEIAEILIYDSALSTANRESVENYLGTKWGITITH